MTISEKITESNKNTKFTLFREGLFYRCYNEDAMVFAQKVKAYKVSAKYIKSVKAEVLSLGFPVSEVEKGSLGIQAIKSALGAASYEEKTDSVVFLIPENLKVNYPEFKDACIKTSELVEDKPSEYDHTNIHILVKMIQDFDLANHTPMQALAFISDLKEVIKVKSKSVESF